jgi:hypothetical protein
MSEIKNQGIRVTISAFDLFVLLPIISIVGIVLVVIYG